MRAAWRGKKPFRFGNAFIGWRDDGASFQMLTIGFAALLAMISGQ